MHPKFIFPLGEEFSVFNAYRFYKSDKESNVITLFIIALNSLKEGDYYLKSEQSPLGSYITEYCKVHRDEISKFVYIEMVVRNKNINSEVTDWRINKSLRPRGQIKIIEKGIHIQQNRHQFILLR